MKVYIVCAGFDGEDSTIEAVYADKKYAYAYVQKVSGDASYTEHSKVAPRDRNRSLTWWVEDHEVLNEKTSGENADSSES